ncbi:protein-methionine-sulfoxide reductase catalytic subunit MsrP [Nitratireductor mangrovi]|uniref:Protein-methionine-sulfoxide reductase catalytic subunit MsrP n=1 Tax=Nitratireductor mangrovi TaxID=2599600 RepID=A0A5B8L2M4_9HYPH|nr:protein-methionine-sulfoxide reductase catalytic subunit MsrP [Nitratireductor mangrovi]QDZ01982.1 protein-methionine-sulfoxide reductase catalytic subunit MsrP [Nitratireductor mangrovi]
MAHFHRRPDWAIAEREATPEHVFFNRRAVLAGFGASMAALAAPPFAGRALAADDPTADLYPAGRNEAYTIERDLTPEEASSQYNNFYEFGSHKQIARAAQDLKIRPWDVEIGGLVDKPQKLAFDDLIRKMPLEERLYRHRCVEAWSMTVPWTGFPLSALVELAAPQASAKYVRFETFLDPAMASGQKQVWYPWPYVEGVTMAEAANELAFMVTGVYGKPLAKQFGAPLRLALPWKYGFKSIKSIVKVTFTEERPVSFWERIASNEYGFWANVNPEVPHPRWSQAQERVLHTGETIPTVIYNGYGEQVAGLYEGMVDEALFM